MSWWHAELLRWWREPGQKLILLVIGVVWLTAGALGGMAASDQRARLAAQQGPWERQLEARVAAASLAADMAPAKRAADAFDLGRHLGPRIALMPGPGLALAPADRQAATNQMIGIETRHFDSRKGEPLENPGMASGGSTGLAWLIAVLLPLALISACHGVRLGDRDAGRWRWIASLSGRPWRIVLWAIVVRAGALLLLAMLASVLALGLDAGSGGAALAAWLAALITFVGIWVALAALTAALPVTAHGGTLTLIGAWALTTFALPALLGELARHHAAAPSRLQAVVESRKVLQDAETRNDALLAAWYAAHPSWAAPASDKRHAWPVSFVPRYLEIDRQLRALMLSFDSASVRQAQQFDRLAWMSPALWLAGTGDVLAGHTAARQYHYLRELERREHAWRSQLVPAVMSYRGLAVVDVAQLKAVGAPVTLPHDHPR